MNMNDVINDAVNQPEHRAFLREVQAAMIDGADELQSSSTEVISYGNLKPSQLLCLSCRLRDRHDEGCEAQAIIGKLRRLAGSNGQT